MVDVRLGGGEMPLRVNSRESSPLLVAALGARPRIHEPAGGTGTLLKRPGAGMPA